MCFQMLPKLSIAGDLSCSKDRGQTYDEMIEDSCPQAQSTRGGGRKTASPKYFTTNAQSCEHDKVC